MKRITTLLVFALFVAMIPNFAFAVKGDVDGDGKIGLVETIHSLQITAGIKSTFDVDDDDDGFTENQGDCNDSDPSVFPGATEYCGDGIDQNCSGDDLDCLPPGCILAFDGTQMAVENILVLIPGHKDGNVVRVLSDRISWDAEKGHIVIVRDGAFSIDMTKVAFKQGVTRFAVISIDPDGTIHFSSTYGLCDDDKALVERTTDDSCTHSAGAMVMAIFNQNMAVPVGEPVICRDVDLDDDGYSVYEGDCDDTDPSIHPGAQEICGDGIDQNCNGSLLACDDTIDDDLDGFTEMQGDCDDTDPTVYPGATEICGDGIDQNCSGDDSVCDPVPSDIDGDGFTVEQGDCNDMNITIYPGASEICGDGIDQDCDGSDQACPLDPADVDDDADGFTENQGDCDDNNASIYPGATEICDDGIDQDCSGIDKVCDPEPSDIDGDGFTVAQGDCNDVNKTVYPGAGEICDDGVDQSCDGSDARCPNPDKYDDDMDGFTENQGDCDDTDPSIRPGATEICGDGIDQDCSGSDRVCDSEPTDIDGDGFTVAQGDCNDVNKIIYPGAPEICGDGVDQNCDGSDKLCDPSPNDVDDDSDSFTENEGDCDDTDPSVYPGATEICGDGIDQDCNGSDLPCLTPGCYVLLDSTAGTLTIHDIAKHINNYVEGNVVKVVSDKLTYDKEKGLTVSVIGGNITITIADFAFADGGTRFDIIAIHADGSNTSVDEFLWCDNDKRLIIITDPSCPYGGGNPSKAVYLDPVTGLYVFVPNGVNVTCRAPNGDPITE